MNEQLKRAETALLDALSHNPRGVTMDEILKELGGTYAEPELRAAVWTLKARGDAEFRDGRLMPHALAA
jgi:hypothetical protein